MGASDRISHRHLPPHRPATKDSSGARFRVMAMATSERRRGRLGGEPLSAAATGRFARYHHVHRSARSPARRDILHEQIIQAVIGISDLRARGSSARWHLPAETAAPSAAPADRRTRYWWRPRQGLGEIWVHEC